jgi:hypothetical protein
MPYEAHAAAHCIGDLGTAADIEGNDRAVALEYTPRRRMCRV